VRECSSWSHNVVFLVVLQVVLACLSSEFVRDDRCTKLFYLAKSSMQKVIQVVLLGADQNWMNTTDIGMQVSTEVLIQNIVQLNSYLYFSKTFLLHK